MLVQGFIDLVGHVLCGSDKDTIRIMGGANPPCGIIEIGTPTYRNTGIYSSNVTSQCNVTANWKQIVLGTSDIPAKSTDCNIQDSKYASVGTVAWGHNKVIVTGTYTNSTTEPTTFKEIGLKTSCYGGGSDYSILLSRSVFPEPVVIPAGESKSFTITIDFNKFADTVVTA